MNIQSGRPVLSVDEAVRLWLSGKDEWNNWSAINPGYDISFEGYDFSQHRKDQPVISFEGFNFHYCAVSFHNAKFGDGDVSFKNASFGHNRKVWFSNMKFGRGKKDFSGVKFGQREVDFKETDFGPGSVCFMGTIFGKSTDFYAASFTKSSVSFQSAHFSDVSFRHTKFGDAIKDFSKTKIKEGNISFDNASFKLGDVTFESCEFESGVLSFQNTSFGEGSVVFRSSKLGNMKVSINKSSCVGTSFNFEFLTSNALFEIKDMKDPIERISFYGASFENALSISNVDVRSIPDFVNTKLSNQLSLHRIKCELKRKRYRGIFQIASDADDIERANRLKELAEANKHHSLALHFHAIELRAKRWQSQSGLRSSMLDVLFDMLCNYGQSVYRPLIIWVMLTILCAIAYGALFRTQVTTLKQVANALIFSFTNSLPFLNTANEGRKAMESLFEPSTVISYVLPLMMTQGVLSVLMVFLLVLGLRNRFRI